MTEDELIELLEGYLTEPPYAKVQKIGDNRLLVTVPDGSTFTVRVTQVTKGGLPDAL